MKPLIDYSAYFQAQLDFLISGNAKLINPGKKPWIRYKRRKIKLSENANDHTKI